MPGDGTKLAITTNSTPPARLLDVTRLLRRAGNVLTGVDRVELAYLDALLADPVPVFGLVRSRFGYILLDEVGLSRLLNTLTASGPVDAEGLWRTVRRDALRRVPPQLLKRALRRTLPQGTAYLNVGHSNLTERVLQSVKSALGARIAVLIHDVIPLSHPQYQRPETHGAFSAMLDRVGRYADLVIYNSNDTQGHAETYLPKDIASIVAHLGTNSVAPDANALPADVPPAAPYFVVLGTIEPRKNHGFLLDLWEDMGADAPGLVIVGNRGWNNDAVFERLNALPSGSPIREIQGLSDAAVAALVQRSCGLLFPSFVEGYGLPAVEAVARGVPVLANDLSVYREVLGDIPIYASVSDRYLWKNKIKTLVEAAQTQEPKPQFVAPTWAQHFKTVLKLT